MSTQLFKPLILNIALDNTIIVDPSHQGEWGEGDDRTAAGSKSTNVNIGTDLQNNDGGDLFE